MTQDITLAEKRRLLKLQLTQGDYKSLAEVLLDKVSTTVQRVLHSPRPLSSWSTAILLGTLSLLLVFIASAVLGEYSNAYTRRLALADLWLLGIMSVWMLVLPKLADGMLHGFIHDYIVDGIESISDLDDLQRYFARVSNLKTQVIVSVAFVLVLEPFSIYDIFSTVGGFPGYGPILADIMWAVAASFAFYAWLRILGLLLRLSHLRLQLFSPEPRDSVIVLNLSKVANRIVLVAAGTTALLTLFNLLSELLITPISILGVLLLAWAPVVILFVNSQYCLSNLIAHAKRGELDKLQAMFTDLRYKEEVPSSATLEQMDKLLDYYDRIKDSRSLALDFRTILNFVNSMLLPLVAWVLANFDKLRALLH